MTVYESKLDESRKWFTELRVDDNSEEEDDDLWAFSTQSNTAKIKGKSKKV